MLLTWRGHKSLRYRFDVSYFAVLYVILGNVLSLWSAQINVCAYAHE